LFSHVRTSQIALATVDRNKTGGPRNVQNNLRILILQARRGGGGMGETFAELNRESRVLKPHKSAEKGYRKFTLARQSSERVGVKFLDLFSNSAMQQSLEKSSFHVKTFLHNNNGL
jgi:hypothetical protein